MKKWYNPTITNLCIKGTLEKLEVPANAWCINQPNKGPANGKDKVCRHASATQTIQSSNPEAPYYCPYVAIHSQVPGADRQCTIGGDNIEIS